MAGDAVASSTPTRSGLPRPTLKGLHNASVKKHLAIGIVWSLAAMIIAKIAVNDPRKEKYAEYYKNYDIEANFERIRKAGWFSSCSPDDN